MGKVLISDEGNLDYTANVTSNGALQMSETANKFYKCNSAQNATANGSAERIYEGACWVKGLIFGSYPATATTVGLYDTYTCASNLSSFGKSGSNIIATLGFEPTAGALSAMFLEFPKTIPLNVYCASGITVSIGLSAADSLGRIGTLKNMTVVYQTV